MSKLNSVTTSSLAILQRLSSSLSHSPLLHCVYVIIKTVPLLATLIAGLHQKRLQVAVAWPNLAHIVIDT